MVKSVLISKDYFPPQIGGISTMMWEICSALGPAEVCALTAVDADAGLPPRIDGIRVFRKSSPFAKGTVRQALGLASAILDIGLHERPRVVQMASCDEAYIGYHLHRLTGLPYLVYAHGNDILSAARNTWPKARLGVLAANRVIANSNYTAGLLQGIGVPARNIVIVHPGCNVDRFVPAVPSPHVVQRIFGDAPRGPVLLTVGGLVARKGQDIVLRALPALAQRYPDLRYIMVGYGPERGALEQLASSLGVARHAVFAGKLPHEEILDYFALADVFVMPSHVNEARCDVEGFGIVFLEANACGKPVVGGRSGGIPDAVLDGETGLLVDPMDPEAVVAAVGRLLDNPAYARQLGEQGRKRALREFAWPVVGARVRAVLEEVASNPRPRDA